MNISVIISSWNNQKLLHRTLSSFTELSPVPNITWELIVIDNNSTDSTRQTASKFKESLPLKYFFEAQQGLSRARNLGLEKSTGELILFTDDDVLLPQDWLGIYWRAFQAYPDRVFGGPVESEYEKNAPPRSFERYTPWSVKGLDHGKNDRLLNQNEQFLAANWGTAKIHLERAGGFDENLGLNGAGTVTVGEESDLQRKLRRSGHPLFYLARARIQHFVPAHKCSESHIAKRAEAGNFEFHRVLLRESNSLKRFFFLLLAPTLMAWRYGLLQWANNFRTSSKALRYIQYRSACGMFRAVKEMKISFSSD